MAPSPNPVPDFLPFANFLFTRGDFCFQARSMNQRFRTLLVLVCVSNLSTVCRALASEHLLPKRGTLYFRLWLPSLKSRNSHWTYQSAREPFSQLTCCGRFLRFSTTRTRASRRRCGA